MNGITTQNDGYTAPMELLVVLSSGFFGVTYLFSGSALADVAGPLAPLVGLFLVVGFRVARRDENKEPTDRETAAAGGEP